MLRGVVVGVAPIVPSPAGAGLPPPLPAQLRTPAAYFGCPAPVGSGITPRRAATLPICLAW